MSSLLGCEVIVSPYIPKKQRVRLSENCGCSPEFVRQFNNWLRDRFGEDDQVLIFGNKMAMTPAAFTHTRSGRRTGMGDMCKHFHIDGVMHEPCPRCAKTEKAQDGWPG